MGGMSFLTYGYLCSRHPGYPVTQDVQVIQMILIWVSSMTWAVCVPLVTWRHTKCLGYPDDLDDLGYLCNLEGLGILYRYPWRAKSAYYQVIQVTRSSLISSSCSPELRWPSRSSRLPKTFTDLRELARTETGTESLTGSGTETETGVLRLRLKLGLILRLRLSLILS